MTNLSPQHASGRAPRTCFAETTPAVLRFADGRSVPAKLQVISVTGGLLSLSKPLDHGSEVKLMFLTPTGSVLAVAEMLSPVSWHLQPFKFIALDGDDQRRLQAVIQSSMDQNRRDHGQVERSRAW
jgi:hypothetical protein